MTQDDLKKAAAKRAIEYIELNDVIGVGSGSTVAHFIDALASVKGKLKGAVASSNNTQKALEKIGIEVFDLNHVGQLKYYFDGADEITEQGYMIKGGGGALTREKIIAQASENFICIADDSKKVKVLGEFPLPIEVIPMARSLIGRNLTIMGANPQYRAGFTTDNENIILDVKGLDLTNPIEIEREINDMPGVVSNGLFAIKGANTLLCASQQGVEKTQF